MESRRSTKHGVDAIRGEHRLCNALRRILIVVEARGSKSQIEIGDDRRHLRNRREAPRQIVGDGGGSNSPLGANDRDHTPKGLRAGHREQLGYRLDEVDDAERRHQIFADPTRHQLPVENDVIELAENDDLGPRIAIFSELFELAEQRLPTRGGFEHDDIRRRRAFVGFNRRRRAAHVLLDMRLGHSAIGYRGADDGCDIGRFAKRLDRHARHRLDLRRSRRSMGASPSIPLAA